MTEEIKRILIDMDLVANCNKVPIYYSQKEIKLLLDYITNLQQLYENGLKVNQNTEKYRTELETKCVILQQENESLKQILHNITINGVEEENTTVLDLINENKKLKECYCNRTDCSGRLKDSKKYDSVYQEKEDYKLRCKKAVEYIKEHIKYECDDNFNGMSFYSYHLYDFKKEDLLNILNGSDENETK